MQGKLLGELKSNLAFMSGVEKKIACIILEDPKKFTSYSLMELSELSGVSQGSIINFANKFVGGGYPELKLNVAACVPSGEKEFSDIEDGFKRRVLSVGAALQNTLNVNVQGDVYKVAEKILAAKKVEIYGVYRSAVVATDFYYHLLELGIPANFVSDVLTCAVSASLLSKDSLVVAVSSSGRTKDVIDAVRLAKANGVEVVCITANKNSPLAKLSDYIITVCSSGNETGFAEEVRLSQLVVTDVICEYIRNKLSALGKTDNETMTKILNLHNVND